MNIAPLALVFIVGCATPPEEWAEGQDYKVNPKNTSLCEEEGGCSLVSDYWLRLMMLRAYRAGQAASKGSL